MPCDQSAMVLGKVALVTGAGIGRATAQKFTDEGANVVVSDMDRPGGKETVSLINDLGGDATIIRADVSRRKDVERLIDETLTGYGRRD
jgi:NAD(P)-dependent dehydrogenase (short-subunit alcohol dehydrogenase family)